MADDREALVEQIVAEIEAALQNQPVEVLREFLAFLQEEADIQPCGHPIAAIAGDGMTHWCRMCEVAPASGLDGRCDGCREAAGVHRVR